jgi:hypothetical protein
MSSSIGKIWKKTYEKLMKIDDAWINHATLRCP